MWRSRAPLPSLPGCGYRYQQLPVSPWRSGSCLWQDTVVSRSLWRVGGLHFPTHRACARGGDGQRVTPHIGHWLVEGVGTLSYHTSGRHCRSLRASCRQSPWLTQHWEPGRERHLYFNMALVGTALTRRGAVQVFLLFHPFQVLGTAGHHHRRSPGLDLRTLGGGIYLCQPPRSVFQWPKVLQVHEARLHWGWPGGH